MHDIVVYFFVISPFSKLNCSPPTQCFYPSTHTPPKQHAFRLLTIHAQPIMQDGYEFDIFLSFAEEDRGFVERVLYTPLTDESYAVFWHHKHFICGLTVDDNIARATQISRRIIFVCSKHFQCSEFCQKELRIGLHSHYKDRTRRVIPIVLQEEFCPEELQNFSHIRVNTANTSTSAEIEGIIQKLELGKPMQLQVSCMVVYLCIRELHEPVQLL